MKILLITYHYPPDRAVGGHRARKVTEALRGAGHDVTVIAAGDPGDASAHRVRPLPFVRQLYASLRDRPGRSGGKPSSKAGTAGTEPGKRRTPFWKRWLFSLIWLPDDKQGFILPAVRRGLRLPGGRPDLIYTTAPPFSVHLAGLALKVLIGARWVVEFRDPWTANPWKPPEMRSAFSDWLERRLERLCLESADRIVAVTDGIAARIEETGARTPVVVVRNGIERLRSGEQVAAAGRTNGPFEIVYAGSFYFTRDPFPFLEALAGVVAERSLVPEDVQVSFLGATEEYEGRSIREYLRARGLDGLVRLEGWVEPAESLARVESADALLLLAIGQPDQVPNKVYEYLGARRPILAVADAGGETARMLQSAGGHHIVTVNEVGPIHEAIGRVLGARRQEPAGKPAVLEGWTTKSQMAKLIADLESEPRG